MKDDPKILDQGSPTTMPSNTHHMLAFIGQWPTTHHQAIIAHVMVSTCCHPAPTCGVSLPRQNKIRLIRITQRF